MNYSSPFGKDWKVKKVVSEKEDILQKFKPIPLKISKKIGKELVEKSCSQQELLWIEMWLDNIVRSRSYPPQCAGKDAFNSLTKFLSPQDVLSLLKQLRTDFVLTHPHHSAPTEDFGFLADSEEYLAHQIQYLPSPHNNTIQNDDLS